LTAAKKDHYRKLASRAMYEAEQKKPREQRSAVGFGAEFLGTSRALADVSHGGSMTMSGMTSSAQSNGGGSDSGGGGGVSPVLDPNSFFKHALRKKALCGRSLLELLIAEGDDFGIPPMRLVPGRYLERLARFPRSDEQEMVIAAVPVPLRPSHPRPQELLGEDESQFGVTFVSHRWARAFHPDTEDNAQARALIEYLNSDANPTKGCWRDRYFWIDWSSIDQDSRSQKEAMINALPIYLRCCNHFISLEWSRDYWSRAWCRLEVAGSTLCDSRSLIAISGEVSELPSTEVALEAKMGGRPETGECYDPADLPKIARVVKHMQKMTWAAQGAARDASAAAAAAAGQASPPRAADGSHAASSAFPSASPRSNGGGGGGKASHSSPRGPASPHTQQHQSQQSQQQQQQQQQRLGSPPTMRPMSFDEAANSPRGSPPGKGGRGKGQGHTDKRSPSFKERDLGRFVIQ
jgi:hypothetical protein